MNISFANRFFGRSRLTTEHFASSYGVPVLVDERGQAYGQGDSMAQDDGLDWLNTEFGLSSESATVGEAIAACLNDPGRTPDQIEAAEAFISGRSLG